jgi:hypothetical protein
LLKCHTARRLWFACDRNRAWRCKLRRCWPLHIRWSGQSHRKAFRKSCRKQHRAARIYWNLLGKSGLHSDGQLGSTRQQHSRIDNRGPRQGIRDPQQYLRLGRNHKRGGQKAVVRLQVRLKPKGPTDISRRQEWRMGLPDHRLFKRGPFVTLPLFPFRGRLSCARGIRFTFWFELPHIPLAAPRLQRVLLESDHSRRLEA